MVSHGRESKLRLRYTFQCAGMRGYFRWLFAAQDSWLAFICLSPNRKASDSEYWRKHGVLNNYRGAARRLPNGTGQRNHNGRASRDGSPSIVWVGLEVQRA